MIAWWIIEDWKLLIDEAFKGCTGEQMRAAFTHRG